MATYEIDPRKEYLTQVIREIKQKHAAATNKDPFLDRVYDQLQYKVVTGTQAPFVFSYNSTGACWLKGDKYVYWPFGQIAFFKPTPVRERRRYRHHPDLEISTKGLVDAPLIEELDPEGLLDAINVLLLWETMST